MRVDHSNFGPLAPYLIELAAAFEAQGLQLTLVGGVSLVLRRQWRQEQGDNTLIAAIPEARTTEDFDVLLSLEMISDTAKSSAIRDILENLGYQVIPEREFLQFRHSKDIAFFGKPVKIDFMAPAPAPQDKSLEVVPPRVKRNPSPKNQKLHGRLTEEVLRLSEADLPIGIQGLDTHNNYKETTVFIPHPFTVLIMKLFALRDEYNNKKNRYSSSRAYAIKHISDIYTLIALLNEQEVEELKHFGEEYASNHIYQEAGRIVQSMLLEPTSPGNLLLLENLDISPQDLAIFNSLLADTFKI